MKFKFRSLSLFALALALSGCGRPGSPSANNSAPASDFVSSADAELLLPTHEDLRAKSAVSMSSVRARAEQLLHNAVEKAGDERTRGFLQTMESALQNAKIDVPPAGRDLKTCVQDSAVLAFVNLLAPHTIHVCARAAGASEKKLSQVLVHETAHVAGVQDECEATRIEVAVMRATGARLPFRNGYMKGCGID